MRKKHPRVVVGRIVRDLRELLEDSNTLHRNGEPTFFLDQEWDHMLKALEELERGFPLMKTPNSITERVG